MKKHTKTLIMLLLVSVMTLSTAMTCFATEAVDGDYIEITMDQYEVPMELGNTTGKVPVYLYIGIQTSQIADWYNRQTGYVGTLLENDGTFRGLNIPFFGIDAKEVAELDHSILYEYVAYMPADCTLLIEDFIPVAPIEGREEGQEPELYIYAEKQDQMYHDFYDSLCYGYTITEDSFIIIADGTKEDDDQYWEYVDAQYELLLSRKEGTSNVAVVTPPTEEEVDAAVSEQDVLIEEIPELGGIVGEITAAEAEDAVTAGDAVVQDAPPAEEEPEKEKVDIKVWLIGGFGLLALFLIALKCAPKGNDKGRNE